jgi:hypothetical protein
MDIGAQNIIFADPLEAQRAMIRLVGENIKLREALRAVRDRLKATDISNLEEALEIIARELKD